MAGHERHPDDQPPINEATRSMLEGVDGAVGLAASTAAFFNGLVEAGLSIEHALFLTNTWLTGIFTLISSAAAAGAAGASGGGD